MTEPKPVEGYETNTTNDLLELAVSTTMPRIPGTPVPQPPSLLERVDNLEALMLDLFKRVQALEAEAWPQWPKLEQGQNVNHS